MYARQVYYRTYVSPKIEPKKIKGYCTTCAKNRKLTSWTRAVAPIGRPDASPACRRMGQARQPPARITAPLRRFVPSSHGSRCGHSAPTGALAGGLRAMTANDLFSTACRDRARPRSAWDALPCAALPPPEACEELPSWCWTDFLYRSAAGAVGEIMGQGEGLQWRPGRRPAPGRPNSNREQMHEALLKLRPETRGFGISRFREFW